MKILVVWSVKDFVIGVIMLWKSLEKKIQKSMSVKRYGDDYLNAYLNFAHNLFNNGVPLIATPQQFSDLVGIEHEYICKMAYAQNKFYRHFQINKKSGGKRNIFEPLPDLKFVQDWILRNILEKISVSVYAKAFVKKRDLKQNARFHRKQDVVVTMDIKDFFPSIRVYDVYRIFRDVGYLENVCWFLANLCCLDKSLPQGAPTSPYLSNLRMKKFDGIVANYMILQKINYTRYADDLTFSGCFDPHKLISYISKLVYKEGFCINPKKTRVAYQNTRQEVTGIVVNKKMQVSIKLRKSIRQQVYYIKKYGINSHLSKINEQRKHYLEHLLGQINFACYVNPYDVEMKEYCTYVKGLLIR